MDENMRKAHDYLLTVTHKCDKNKKGHPHRLENTTYDKLLPITMITRLPRTNRFIAGMSRNARITKNMYTQCKKRKGKKMERKMDRLIL